MNNKKSYIFLCGFAFSLLLCRPAACCHHFKNNKITSLYFLPEA